VFVPTTGMVLDIAAVFNNFILAVKHLVDGADHVCHVVIRELRRERQTYRLLPNAEAMRIIFGCQPDRS